MDSSAPTPPTDPPPAGPDSQPGKATGEPPGNPQATEPKAEEPQAGVATATAPESAADDSLTPGPRPRQDRWPRLLGRAWGPGLAILLLALATFTLYAQNLDVTQLASREAAAEERTLNVPPIAWDEHYYISIAHQQAAGVWLDPCWGERPSGWDHPPFAKHILTASVKIADIPRVFSGCRLPDERGDQRQSCYPDPLGRNLTTGYDCYQAFMDDLRDNGNAYSWRLPSAILGTLTVTATALAARRILGSTAAGVLAGALVALDGMMFVVSRMALLDIFAAGFACLALWSATFANAKGRIAAGVLLGLAFSSKYTALFTGLPILLVALWAHHRESRLTRRAMGLTVASMVGLPILVWLLCYLPWWFTWIGGHGPAWAVGYFAEMQMDAFDWQATATIHNPSTSQPWQWFLLDTPVWFFSSGPRAIYGLPNPFIWWGGAIASMGSLLWLRVVQAAPTHAVPAAPARPAGSKAASNVVRGPGTPTQQALAVCALLPALGYGGFLLLPRSSFLYYMAVIVPFLAIATAAFIWTLRDRPGPMALLAGGLFLAFFVPAAASFWNPELVPGSAYLVWMLGAGAATASAAVGCAFPAVAQRGARLATAMLLLLTLATFVHQFPLLQGLPTDLGQRAEIAQSLPWALR